MRIILTFLFSIGIIHANASHIAGGLITYEATGIANEYDFTLTIYRDCNSFANLGNTTPINIMNNCGIAGSNTLLLTRISVTEISQICAADLPNTSFNGGPGLFEGMEKQVFTGTHILASCSNWTLSWTACNRNASVNLLNSDSHCFYTETKINNQNYTCNSSPIVTGLYQIPYICVNQPTNLSSFVVDPDGDSLHFSFANALGANAVPLQYNPPYSSTAPITGITLSPTGDITVNHNIAGNFVLTILIEEFDAQGAFKGSILHDFQFVIEICTNQTPIYSSVTSFTNNGTNASISGDTIYAGPNDEFCIDIQFTDADINQQLQTTTDILNFLPNAVVTSTPGNPSTTTICWNYNTNHIGSSFSVKATDDACPVPGIASKIFALSLPTSLANLPDTIPFCNNALPPLNFACNNTDILEWTDTNGTPLIVGVDISCNPCNDPNFLFTNDSLISVRLFAAPFVSKPIFVEYISGNINIFPDTTFICAGDTYTFLGPYPNHYQVWTINNLTSILDTIVIDSSNQGMLHYSLNVQNTCFLIDSTVITVNDINVIATNTGSNIEASSHFGYQWLFNNTPILGENSQIHSPQNNGDYSVIGYDLWNCSDTSNIITITTASNESYENSIKILRIENTVRASELNTNGEIRIFDLQGKLLIQEKIVQSEMQISLPSKNQIYLLQIISTSGGVIETRKL